MTEQVKDSLGRLLIAPPLGDSASTSKGTLGSSVWGKSAARAADWKTDHLTTVGRGPGSPVLVGGGLSVRFP